MPSYLLDSHTLVWLSSNRKRFGRRANRILQSQQLSYCSISIAELSAKARAGKLNFDISVVGDWESLGMRELSFGRLAAIEYGSINPAHVRDPFDRMIMAAARANGHLLLTADSQLLEYGADWIVDATT